MKSFQDLEKNLEQILGVCSTFYSLFFNMYIIWNQSMFFSRCNKYLSFNYINICYLFCHTMIIWNASIRLNKIVFSIFIYNKSVAPAPEYLSILLCNPYHCMPNFITHIIVYKWRRSLFYYYFI